MIRKSFVVLGSIFSGCGLCCASSYTGLHTGCAHDDCHPMNGTGEALEQFMKMEEEVFSSLKCFDNHLKDLEKLDMKLAMQENYIRFIRAKLQGLIHGNLCGCYGSGGFPSLQNNLNSQTVVNNNTTMNTTNNTSINNNYSQILQQSNTQTSNYRTGEDSEKQNFCGKETIGFSEGDKARIKFMWVQLTAQKRQAILQHWAWLNDPKLKANL